MRFFAPLEIAAALLAGNAAVAAWFLGAPDRGLLTASALLAAAVIAQFPLYFKNANARFAAGTIPVAAVAPELARWARWHWSRVALALAAFALAAL